MISLFISCILWVLSFLFFFLFFLYAGSLAFMSRTFIIIYRIISFLFLLWVIGTGLVVLSCFAGFALYGLLAFVAVAFVVGIINIICGGMKTIINFFRGRKKK